MNKLKDIIEFVKDKLQNKRTRAITLLSLYFIFFAFVFVFIKINSNSVSIQPDSEKESIITNKYINLSKDYSYKYSIEIQTFKEVNKYQMVGRYINNETDYTIEKLINNKYAIIDNFDLINKKMLYIENILKCIENKEYEYQTKYKNGGVLENYRIPIKELDENYTDDDMVEINIESKDNFINKITFNCSKLDQFINKNVIISKYDLEYEIIK